MDGMQVIDAAVYTALTDNDDLVELVSTEDDLIKIWKNAAPPKLATAYPYVLMSYASGGLLNDAPYDALDMELLVTGVATDSVTAKEIAGLIQDQLKNQTLTYSDGWVSWSTVRQTDFFSREVDIQNAQYHQVGAYYRFRASKGKL